jgi:hypothetical protein
MSYRITPKPGLIIRDPEHEGRILSAEGITVNKLNPFWRRRHRDGSVDIFEIPVSPAPAPTPLTSPYGRREET